MKDIEKLISPFVASQFPEFYRSDGPRFVDFVKQYYVWMEQQNNALGAARNLGNTRDIDKTSDEFLKYFKEKYVKGLPLTTEIDTRKFVKNAVGLYHVKGTEIGVQFVIQGLFNKEAKVRYPGNDIFKLSDGKWVVPRYLELTITDRVKEYVGKEIVGDTSGAKAFCEGVVRRRIGTKYIDVVYLSNLRGDFKTGEYITTTVDRVLEGAPAVIGSLTSLTVRTGGALFKVGDLFKVSSTNGKQGVARVTSVSDQTGKVTFIFEDAYATGGWGYSNTAEVIISTKVLEVADVQNSNSQITSLQRFELINQTLANIAYTTASPNNSGFTVGAVIENYDGLGAVTANAVIVSVGTTSSTAGYLVVALGTGNIAAYDTTFALSGNGTTAVITEYYDRSVTANVVGSNTTHVGVNNIVGGAFVATPYARITGVESNTSYRIANVSTGYGATFSVGNITDVETVFLTPDFISSNNTQKVRYAGYQPKYITVNANTSVSNTTGRITKSSHGFANGEYVVYQVSGGNTAIGGLVDGTGYYVAQANTTTFKLSTTRAGTTTISLTSGVTETGHTFLSLYNSSNSSSINLNGNNSGAALQYGTPKTLTTGDTAYGGFGFPKFPSSNLDSILFDVLRFESKTIGSIASLIGIDPGAEYNMDPFVAVIEPQVAAYNHHDIVLDITSVTGRFIPREQIQQAQDSVGRQLTVVSFAGTTANGTVTDTPYIGELVYQRHPNNAIRATGIVSEGLLSGGAGSFKMKTFSGTFVTTANASSKLYSQTSNAVANVTAVDSVTITTNARGIVKDTSNTTVLQIKRITLENTFVAGQTILGRTSGASANVSVVDVNRTTEVIGLNANVSANVQTALGVVTDLSVQDSGFGYLDQELVTLTSEDSIYQVTAVALLDKQGVGSGYYASTGGFLDSDKRLHDNDYYQEYSYEVETKVPFDKYVEVLKSITHVAGTKIFGAVESVSVANMPMTVTVGDGINKIEIS
jgi:hypothetical protein